MGLVLWIEANRTGNKLEQEIMTFGFDDRSRPEVTGQEGTFFVGSILFESRGRVRGIEIDPVGTSFEGLNASNGRLDRGGGIVELKLVFQFVEPGEMFIHFFAKVVVGLL